MMSRSRIARVVAAFLAFALVQAAFGVEAWAQVAVLGRAVEGIPAAAVGAAARPIEFAPTLGGSVPLLAAPSVLSVAPSPVAAAALPVLAAPSAAPASAAPTARAAAALPALAAASAPAREREGNDPRAAAGAAFDGAAAKKTVVEALEAGERVYAPEGAGTEIDAQTAADLEVDALHAQLAAKAKTAYGAARLKALLARPFLDAREIRRRQEAVRALADDPALGGAVSEALAKAAPDAHAKARESLLSYAVDKATFLIAAPFGLAALYLQCRLVNDCACLAVVVAHFYFHDARVRSVRSSLRQDELRDLQAHALHQLRDGTGTGDRRPDESVSYQA